LTRKEFVRRIRDHQTRLPRNQKRVADCILNDPDRVPFMAVQDLADEAGTSVASVVRMAQSLGFKGYSELREAVRRSLQDSLQKDLFSMPAPIEDPVFRTVVDQDIRDINDTIKQLAAEDFDRIIRDILNAAAVYTCGMGISHLMSRILAYQLSQVGVRAQAFIAGSDSFVEQLHFLSSRDLLIVLSYPPYSPETLQAAEKAASEKIPLLGITDSAAAPLNNITANILQVRSENLLFTNSLAAMTVMINAIATECARMDPERAEKRFAGLEGVDRSSGGDRLSRL